MSATTNRTARLEARIAPDILAAVKRAADALLRAAQSEVMAHALVVSAKNENASRFYGHLGFEEIDDDGRRLIRRL